MRALPAVRSAACTLMAAAMLAVAGGFRRRLRAMRAAPRPSAAKK